MKQYFNNLEAEQYFSEIFNREEALTARESLSKLLENFSKNTSENGELVKDFKNKFEEITKQIETITKTVEKDMNEVYDEKLHVWVEKIKKQNQDLWQESLKNIKTDFKDIGSFI